ncbi:hypothetical protein [Vreelandella populi]|uniref:hypothetical protein n=1 Tax=Vreelandella populi TaxID=2498858 RepID=UPI000F8E3F2A|nr:hypothetical protein [Halomonas populi]RUR53684.1 hypothetical protein ELY40_10635 [Halomonas populi]
MRLTPWLLSLMLSAPFLITVGSAFAEPEAGGEQHEPLDDAALEEKYGIKAGAVQRDGQTIDTAAANDTDTAEHSDGVKSDNVESDGGDPTTSDNGDAESKNTEGGTGGTGSAEDAIESGEDEKSNDDDNGEGEQKNNDNQ